MVVQQARSFAHMSVLEAAARRLRVDLVLKRVTPGTDTRLRSRFLGIRNPDRLVLAVPETRRGKKVFVPKGWDLGIGFELADQWLQARTTVVGHCLYPVHATRRVDGLMVQQPDEILSRSPRRKPRYEVDPSRLVTATIWPVECLKSTDFATQTVGRVLNWSETGLGVKLSASLPFQAGAEVLVRLETENNEETPIYRGVLKHCTAHEAGAWLAGIGDVTHVQPGEALTLAEFLATPQAEAIWDSSSDRTVGDDDVG